MRVKKADLNRGRRRGGGYEGGSRRENLRARTSRIAFLQQRIRNSSRRIEQAMWREHPSIHSPIIIIIWILDPRVQHRTLNTRHVGRYFTWDPTCAVRTYFISTDNLQTGNPTHKYLEKEGLPSIARTLQRYMYFFENTTRYTCN